MNNIIQHFPRGVEAREAPRAREGRQAAEKLARDVLSGAQRG